MIYRLSGATGATPEGTGWEQITPAGGRLKQVDVNGRGSVWGVNASNMIYRWTGSTWEQVAGSAKSVAVGAYGGRDVVWCVNASDMIYFREGVTAANPAGTGWRKMDGALAQLAVNDQGAVWGVSSAGDVWTRYGVKESGGGPGSGWINVPGQKLKHVAVGSDGSRGDEVWGVSPSGEVFRREGVAGVFSMGSGWARVPGSLKQVAVGRHGARAAVWGVNASDMIYRWMPAAQGGAGAGAGEWRLIPGALKHVATG